MNSLNTVLMAEHTEVDPEKANNFRFDEDKIAEERIFIRRLYKDGTVEEISLEKRPEGKGCFYSREGIVHVDGTGQISHRNLSRVKALKNRIRQENAEILKALQQEKIRQGWDWMTRRKWSYQINKLYDLETTPLRKTLVKDYDRRMEILTRVNKAQMRNNLNTFEFVSEIPDAALTPAERKFVKSTEILSSLPAEKSAFQKAQEIWDEDNEEIIV